MTDIHLAHSDDLTPQTPALPDFAASPINRCNLPAVILGGCTYQKYPVPLMIDSVEILHWRFFRQIDRISSPSERAVHFHRYMCSAFLLEQPDQAGFSPDNIGIRRDRATYLRLLRGWMFEADSVEAAVMKRWVESRFGLLTLYHKGRITSIRSEEYQNYLKDYVRGLYNSNALEAQLDLLYTYCQYELSRQWPELQHKTLYRGVLQLEQFYPPNEHHTGINAILLNNLNSFSSDRDQAGIFGHHVIDVQVPTPKILYFPGLLPNVLQGEDEYLVIGGMYRIHIV
jgi:NAD+--dinitrogen-reductase ADP-D-ribosyltransferase